MAKSVGSLAAALLLAVWASSAEAHAQRAGNSARADVGLVIAGSATAGFGAVALIVGLEGLLATYNPTGDMGSWVWLSVGIGGSTLGVLLLVFGLISQEPDNARTHPFDGMIRF